MTHALKKYLHGYLWIYRKPGAVWLVFSMYQIRLWPKWMIRHRPLAKGR